MVIVDTSVWIDFFNQASSAKRLSELLTVNQVILHPWVYGELMVGNLSKKSRTVLSDLALLPSVRVASLAEIEQFVNEQTLMGIGLSLVDVHVIFSAMTENHLIWTHDRTLQKTSKLFGKEFRLEFLN